MIMQELKIDRFGRSTFPQAINRNIQCKLTVSATNPKYN